MTVRDVLGLCLVVRQAYQEDRVRSLASRPVDVGVESHAIAEAAGHVALHRHLWQSGQRSRALELLSHLTPNSESDRRRSPGRRGYERPARPSTPTIACRGGADTRCVANVARLPT